jgi:hypothetical protein
VKVQGVGRSAAVRSTAGNLFVCNSTEASTNILTLRTAACLRHSSATVWKSGTAYHPRSILMWCVSSFFIKNICKFEIFVQCCRMQCVIYIIYYLQIDKHYSHMTVQYFYSQGTFRHVSVAATSTFPKEENSTDEKPSYF